jgi:hypothetical protein
MAVNKHKFVLNYRGVKVYHRWKGTRALTFWYALTPEHDAEGGGQDFDVRTLPAKYTQGLVLVDDREDLLEIHKIALRRAIDDGYDLFAPRRQSQTVSAGRLPRPAPSLVSWSRGFHHATLAMASRVDPALKSARKLIKKHTRVE